MTRVYYKDAVGCLLLFDVTRASTFEAVVRWKNDLDSKVTLPDGSPIPCVLLANKCDLAKEGLSQTQMEEFCKDKGFIGWFETSAKENTNVESAAKFLVTKIVEAENTIKKQEEEADNEKLQITNDIVKKQENKKSGCC